MAGFERIDEIKVPDYGPDFYDFSDLYGIEQLVDGVFGPTKRVDLVELIDGDLLDESVLTDVEVGKNSDYMDYSERHGEY